MLDLRLTPERPLISASILSADFGAIADDARDALDRGADLLHVDVMDGHFVGNLTMGADMLRGLRKHLPETFLDVHLMVDQPGMYVEPFARAGANHFTFHLEVCDPVRANHASAEALIDAIHERGMTAGMAINPLTDVHGLAPYLERIDLALVMSVHPGKSGQRFIADVLEKTRWLRERAGDRLRVEMDGGLNGETTSDAVHAGADVIVTASALFGVEGEARTALIKRMHAASTR